MTTLYAVMSEGHVLDAIVADNSTCIIVATSVWQTREEAEYAINRTFSRSFGSWKPKRRWIEEIDGTTVTPAQVSNLQHSAVELSDGINYYDR